MVKKRTRGGVRLFCAAYPWYIYKTQHSGKHCGQWWFCMACRIMASLAEMERELVVERTRAGLKVARQLGRKGRRKPKMTSSKIESAEKLLVSGVPPKDVARNLGVSIPTLYRWVPASAQAWRTIFSVF
jgi:DNA invertase Pin-like site-specific DNA recombinase